MIEFWFHMVSDRQCAILVMTAIIRFAPLNPNRVCSMQYQPHREIVFAHPLYGPPPHIPVSCADGISISSLPVRGVGRPRQGCQAARDRGLSARDRYASAAYV
jgi:hypothetical protein